MANYTNVKNLLPTGDTRTFGAMDWQYIAIHNTANRASARSEVNYMHTGQSEVTYHFAIDDKECVQALPLNKSGWHAGDGGRKGGAVSIGIEICYSLDPDDPRYPVAEDNAAHKTAELLVSKGFGINRVKTHQMYSGKYCPHRMLDNNGWEAFKAKVQKYMNEMGQTGWIKDGYGWWYKNADGSYPTSTWKYINKAWYWFNAKGYAVTGWQYINKRWYYFNSNCQMLEGWIKYKDNWYYLRAKDGDMVSNEFRKINGTWYKFNENGEMLEDTTLNIDKDGAIKVIEK